LPTARPGGNGHCGILVANEQRVPKGFVVLMKRLGVAMPAQPTDDPDEASSHFSKVE
jgi:hypothetical protein